MSFTKQELIKNFREWLSIPENQKYREWHNELCNCGFELDVPFVPSGVTLDSILNEELISQLFEYRYLGDFSVEGDHAYDVFMLCARLIEDGVLFTYTSSYIDEIYVRDNGMAQTQEEVYGYVEKIRAFLEKNRRFLGKSFEVAEQYGRVSFRLLKSTLYSKLHVLEPFIRLAVLMDIQTERKFPFHGIEDYESIYGRMNDVDFFTWVAQFTDGYEESIAHLVGSSYSQQLSDVISRVDKLVCAFSQDAEQNESVLMLLGEILSKLQSMTADDFTELKKAIFDI